MLCGNYRSRSSVFDVWKEPGEMLWDIQTTAADYGDGSSWTTDLTNQWEDENQQERKFLSTQRNLRTPIVRVATGLSMKKAQLTRTKTRQVHKLHAVTLDDTMPVRVKEDRSFRMWYPDKLPDKIAKPRRLQYKRISREKISEYQEVVNKLPWDYIIKEKELEEEIKASGFKPFSGIQLVSLI
ncbi:hypothetical protein Q1695_013146 [Nippostrongylus brasiliensis]|nr:hypothetical protein Q1695_013146 [Nippostrongylus brasiliensis]